MLDLKVLHSLQDLETHGRNLGGMLVVVPDGKAAHYHVGVPDRLHFVHVVRVDDGVEASVELIQKVNDLEWCGVSDHSSEAHDVTEREGGFIQLTRSN